MKESIGSTWLFGIVITFIVLFASIVSMSVNWSRAYKVKDEVINSIENNHGFYQSTLDTISSYMRKVGYRSTGECPEKYHGFSIVGSSSVNNMWNSNGNNFCVKRVDLVKNEADGIPSTGVYGHVSSAYYSVIVFFKLDMPIIGSVFKMNVSGETATIYGIRDYDFLKS